MVTNRSDGCRVDAGVLRRDWWIIALLAATIVAGAVFYPSLPERVPSHWNIAGEIDGYSSRAFAAFFLPLLNVGLYLMFLIIPCIDPRRENYAKFAETYALFKGMLVLFMTGVWALVMATGLGYQVRTDVVIPAAVSILFIAMGNYMGRIKFNYFVGIRVPWTLASEEVWQKTHRVAGKAWVAGGFIGLAGAFLGSPYGFWLFNAGMILAVAWSIIYSYLAYREWKAKGDGEARQ